MVLTTPWLSFGLSTDVQVGFAEFFGLQALIITTEVLQELGLVPKPEAENPLYLAKISQISSDDQDQLRKFIEGLRVCNTSPRSSFKTLTGPQLGVKKDIPVKNKTKRESETKACTNRPLKRTRALEMIDLTGDDVIVVAKKSKTGSRH